MSSVIERTTGGRIAATMATHRQPSHDLLRLTTRVASMYHERGLGQARIAEQLGLSPILMSAANSSGGVMGKMIDAQSIVVASTATNWFGHEGSILRFVFFHSIALACLVGILVTLQAYVFTGMIVH